MEQLGFFEDRKLNRKQSKKQKNMNFKVIGSNDLELTMIQVRLIIHCLKEYKDKLEKMDITGLGAVQEFKLKSELEETIVLLKYLENLHGKPKRNKRIDRFKPGGPGMETFSWLARG